MATLAVYRSTNNSHISITQNRILRKPLPIIYIPFLVWISRNMPHIVPPTQTKYLRFCWINKQQTFTQNDIVYTILQGVLSGKPTKQKKKEHTSFSSLIYIYIPNAKVNIVFKYYYIAHIYLPSSCVLYRNWCI